MRTVSWKAENVGHLNLMRDDTLHHMWPLAQPKQPEAPASRVTHKLT